MILIKKKNWNDQYGALFGAQISIVLQSIVYCLLSLLSIVFSVSCLLSLLSSRSKPLSTSLAGVDRFSCNGVSHCQQTKQGCNPMWKCFFRGVIEEGIARPTGRTQWDLLYVNRSKKFECAFEIILTHFRFNSTYSIGIQWI